jgi:hypothetical protein
VDEHTLYGDSSLPPELDARVRSELGDGERLLWVGQPRPGRFARSAIPIVLFGIPWTAFALFWMATASGVWFGGFKGAGGVGALFACFPLFGLPFVLVGLGMLSSPYWLWRRAKRTCYALTDRRAILWQAGWFGSVEVRSYSPAELTRISRTEHADGSGDLVFEEVLSLGRDSDGHRTTRTTRHGFMAISNVREIEELLRKALLSGGDEGRPG